MIALLLALLLASALVFEEYRIHRLRAGEVKKSFADLEREALQPMDEFIADLDRRLDPAPAEKEPPSRLIFEYNEAREDVDRYNRMYKASRKEAERDAGSYPTLALRHESAAKVARAKMLAAADRRDALAKKMTEQGYRVRAYGKISAARIGGQVV